MNGQPDIRRGGCSAWVLPPDERCARTARSLIRETLMPLGLPGELIQDVVTIASELATNAFLHGLSGPAASRTGAGSPAVPPELWLYRRGLSVAELVCKVFDPLRPVASAPLRAGRPAPFAEGGRGLAVVEGLAADWGVELTRCRLGRWRVPGKAVWAALTLPPTVPRTTLPNPPRAYAAEMLCAALVQRGVTRVRRLHGAGVSVVSVRRGLTVWARDGFSWQAVAGRYVRYPFAELVEVTEQVIRLHEELAARHDALERA
jgi:hypothetical protein